MIKQDDLPKEYVYFVGDSHGLRIDCMVKDVIKNSLGSPEIKMSGDILYATEGLRDYLYDEVYTRDEIIDDIRKAKKALKELFYFFIENPNLIPQGLMITANNNVQRAICDYVAGMSDKMALKKYQELFLPQPWSE
jgi:dGTPase